MAKTKSETDKRLLARHRLVKGLVEERIDRLSRMKIGPRRIQSSLFLGSLNFTLYGIESELRDRGLL